MGSAPGPLRSAPQPQASAPGPSAVRNSLTAEYASPQILACGAPSPVHQSPAQCAGACRPVRNDKGVLPERAEVRTGPRRQRSAWVNAPGLFWLSALGRMWVPVQCAPGLRCIVPSAPGPHRSAPGPQRSALGPSRPCRAHSPLAGLISATEITNRAHTSRTTPIGAITHPPHPTPTPK